MTKQINVVQLLMVTMFGLALAACGGGGGRQPGTPEAAPSGESALENRFRFSTFQNGEHVGEDVILIRRVDGVPPSIVHQYPLAGETDVPTDRVVRVRFDEPMLRSSLTTDRFAVVDGNGAEVPGTLSYEPRWYFWTFRPDAPLEPESRFEVRISARVKDQGGGGHLAEDLVWSFHTGAGPDLHTPAAAGTWPMDGAAAVPAGTRVLISATEPLAPDTLDERAIIAVDADGAPVPGVTAYRGGYLEFLPESPLRPGGRYRFRLEPWFTDSGGSTPTEPFEWGFSTAPAGEAGQWEELAVLPDALNDVAGASTGTAVVLQGVTQVWDRSECAGWDEFCTGRACPAPRPRSRVDGQ